MRQSPERVEKLVLLDTSSRPDTQEQSEARRTQMALAKDGRIREVLEAGFPHSVHPKHRADQRLRDAFIAIFPAFVSVALPDEPRPECPGEQQVVGA